MHVGALGLCLLGSCPYPGCAAYVSASGSHITAFLEAPFCLGLKGQGLTKEVGEKCKAPRSLSRNPKPYLTGMLITHNLLIQPPEPLSLVPGGIAQPGRVQSVSLQMVQEHYSTRCGVEG